MIYMYTYTCMVVLVENYCNPRNSTQLLRHYTRVYWMHMNVQGCSRLQRKQRNTKMSIDSFNAIEKERDDV